MPSCQFPFGLELLRKRLAADHQSHSLLACVQYELFGLGVLDELLVTLEEPGVLRFIESDNVY